MRLKATSFVIGAVLSIVPLHAHACSIDTVATGLDPTQAVTSLTLSAERETLAADAARTQQAFRLTAAFDDVSEIDVTVPYRDSLDIEGVGSVHGPGDIRLRYMRTALCSARWRIAAALRTSLHTGSENFTSGSVRITPSVAASYRAANWLRLIVEPAYGIPFNQRQNLPTIRSASLAARAIIISGQTYVAASMKHRSITGTYRYGTDTASIALGAVVLTDYRAAIFYELPLDNFTYTHSEQSVIGVRFSIQK